MVPWASYASPLRINFDKIKVKTGLSLRDAYKALVIDDYTQAQRLSDFAKKQDVQNIVKSIEEEIDILRKRCREQHQTICVDEIPDLEKQIEFIKISHRNYASATTAQKKYFSAIVFDFHIRNLIFKDEFELWDQLCSNQDKINTPACRPTAAQFKQIFDVSLNLVRLAYLKSTGQQKKIKNTKDILHEIDRLEKK